MRSELREAGLTENEAKIYQALLELGPSKAGLISRKAGLHRRVVYDTMEMLINKGLIGYIIQNNVRLYQASNPNKILDLLKQKQNTINDIIPEMLLLYEKTKEEQGTNFYKGKEGLKTVMEDQISTGKEILILGANIEAYNILQFYFKWFDKKRVKAKIKTKIIFNKTDKKPNVPLSEIKYLPEKYSSPLAINIYGDKVAIILWNKEKPLAIIIKNSLIAEGYRKHFELMWRVAKK